MHCHEIHMPLAAIVSYHIFSGSRICAREACHIALGRLLKVWLFQSFCAFWLAQLPPNPNQTFVEIVRER